MTIIREELSAFAIEWSAPSDEQQFCKLLGDNEELDGKLFHLLDIITLLSYLKYNGLILLLNTQGERDRYLYDRTKYNRKDDGTYWTLAQQEIFMGNPVTIEGFTPRGSFSVYTNSLPELLDEFVYTLIFPTQELVDLVNNNFITPEQRRFEVQLNDANKKHNETMCKTRWALGVSFAGLVAALILPFCTETKIANIEEIKQTIQAAKTEIPIVIETKITNDTIKVDVVKPTSTKRK